MLKQLQNKKIQKNIFLILLAGIGLPFLLWNTPNITSKYKANIDYGKILGRKISQREFEEALNSVKIQSQMQLGKDFYELQEVLNFKKLALERLLLLHEAERKKIKVSNTELISSIQDFPLFQRNGRFDNNLYETIIKYGLHLQQPRIFEEHFRKNLIIKKLYDSVTNNLSLTEEDLEEAYKKENEQLSINFIAANPSDFQKDLTATEEELKDWFSKNSFNFKQPLSFNLEYLTVNSLEKIKHKNFYLANNEDFEKIAQRLKLTIQETGFFSEGDAIPGIGWQENFSKLLPALKAKEILPIQEIDNRYYLLRIKERKEPSIAEYQDVKDKVKEAFTKNKADNIAKEKIESCLKKLKEKIVINSTEVDFDKIAKELGLKSGITDLFKFDSYIKGIGASDKIFTIANNLKEGEISEIINIDSGFYIVKVKSRVPIDEKKFSEEKEEFSKKLLTQKKEEYFSRFLEELKK